ncbi:hypothetical protein HNY73_002624 [Argiope bruennichi]|uniref:Uncharacterized protein n=1 Tax=Argiope bruennichi TaxID=94029 RepID=A0A8T0FWV1_ARGBR|nr:hypothetical protein HNY73_002624 [Argiope bruennichi]
MQEMILLTNLAVLMDLLPSHMRTTPPPYLNEVILAIKTLKNNRMAGTDCITFELLKVEEPEIINAIHKIMIKIWVTEKLSIEWEEVPYVICPIFKKGDQT